MNHDILLNVESKEIRYAHLKNGVLCDLIIERKKSRQLTGNIYRGKVTNVLKNIQSAFIDINESENGFIHVSDIIENTKKFESMFDMDFDLDYDIKNLDVSKKAQTNIEEILKPEQPVLVQVVKEPIGNKGARLTSNISIAGRYLVLLPNSPHRGVSKKIEDVKSRDRLKKLIRAFEMPHDMGLICRTASLEATTEILVSEAHELLEIWNSIVEKFNNSSCPTLLYEDSDLLKKAVTTCVDKKFDRLLVDDYNSYQKCKKLYKNLQNEHPVKIELYRDTIPIFERFNVQKEIDRALKRKIWLPSGGYLFLEKTEAMFTIDVNSGRSSTNDSNLEEVLVQINLEAAEEIARQLRLRNIGGLIIIDFIDMRSKKSQKRVLDCFKEHMKEDSAKNTISNISEFCLVEMTRQRSRESLVQIMFKECPYCHGCSHIRNYDSTSIELERSIKKIVRHHNHTKIRVLVHPLFLNYLYNEDEHMSVISLKKSLKADIDFVGHDELRLTDFQVFSKETEERIDG